MRFVLITYVQHIPPGEAASGSPGQKNCLL